MRSIYSDDAMKMSPCLRKSAPLVRLFSLESHALAGWMCCSGIGGGPIRTPSVVEKSSRKVDASSSSSGSLHGDSDTAQEADYEGVSGELSQGRQEKRGRRERKKKSVQKNK